MPQGGYQIIDEVASGKAQRAPWNPRALFFLTWVMYILVSLMAPLGLAFSAWNWARLGQPQKRLFWLPISLLAFLLPFGLTYATKQEWLSRDFAKIINGVTIFGLAYTLLLQQRPLFERQTSNGQQAANSLPLWVVGLGLCGVLILWITRR